ncbi:hypothetical protein, partial [Shinella sp. G-2]|uniref:hypothetical protein n=1 Tax=Shinella sp. G-2 TaxID=3133141 RepID=UPI003D02A422
ATLADIDTSTAPGCQRLTVEVRCPAALVWLTVNGEPVAFQQDGGIATASLDIAGNTHIHSEWLEPYAPVVIACASDGSAQFAIAENV